MLDQFPEPVPAAQLLGEGAFRGASPDQRSFNAKLLTPAQLLDTAGSWPVRVQVDERGTVLACRRCGGQIEPVINLQGKPYPLRLVQTLANTLRHMVMIHDYALPRGGTNG